MASESESGSKKVTHVIFDVDGLIIDTERLYTEASTEICQGYGKEFTWEIKSKQMGQTEQNAARILIEAAGLPLTVEEYLPMLKKLLSEKFPTVQLLPGAEKLIRHLHKHGVPIAVATGSDKWGLEGKTASYKELFSLFLHAVTASDDPEVKNGKPAPDVFLVAAKRFPDPPKPEETLVFEDAPNGAEAGLAAGMRVVWVPDVRADQTPFKGRVDAILETLQQFKPEEFGLPPYNDSS